MRVHLQQSTNDTSNGSGSSETVGKTSSHSEVSSGSNSAGLGRGGAASCSWNVNANEALASGGDHGEERIGIGNAADVQAAKHDLLGMAGRDTRGCITYERACDADEHAQDSIALALPVVHGEPVVRPAIQLE
jgi:hypothetical protein